MHISRYHHDDKILLAVDCIIFGFDGRQLQALCIKRGFEPEQGNWSLMGGFVNEEESVDNAALRVLSELTGITDIYMEQLACFGEVNRDTAGRVVSIAYYALIKLGDYSEQLQRIYEAKWFPLSEIPPLIFDHPEMVQKALIRLKEKVAHHPIGFELLPEKFTLPQLQNLYEAIYEGPIDKRNFTRKILSLNILNKLPEKEKESSRKGAFYYVFDRERYEQLAHEGMKFI